MVFQDDASNYASFAYTSTSTPTSPFILVPTLMFKCLTLLEEKGI
jgi:hypothetical protein